LKTADG